MRTRGMTLVELVTAMVLAGILLLVMTCQFIAHQRITTGINNQNAAAQEAVVAMRHMSKTLKFALFADSTKYKPPKTVPADPRYARSVRFTIEGGDPITDPWHYHLPEFTANTRIEYGVTAGGDLEYRTDSNPDIDLPTGAPVTMATELFANSCKFNIIAPNFVIQLRIRKSNAVIIVNTAIHALPE